MNLVLAGVLGVLFFWLTDPVYGLARRSAGEIEKGAGERSFMRAG